MDIEESPGGADERKATLVSAHEEMVVLVAAQKAVGTFPTA